MKSVKELPKLNGAPVLVRVDYNVPMKNGKIVDARRIEASYETIDIIIRKGGTPLLVAHLGDGKESLRPVASFLSKRYGIVFIDRLITEKGIPSLIHAVPKGTVILFENIRRYKGEEKNAVSLSRSLASLAKYYVNDAFSVSHRAHASVLGVAKLLPAFAGIQLTREINALLPVIRNPKHPFVFILGGAKFSTKIPILSRFEKSADSIIISGAILNNFYKVAGFEVGKSVVEEGYDKQIKNILSNPKLLLPTDVVVLRRGVSKTVPVDEVLKGDIIVDIGEKSIRLISERIQKAKLVVWNGPTGWYEKGYTKGTVALAKAVVKSNARSVIGGGDTGAVIEKLIDPKTKHVFVSTGGGATLEYLSEGTLVGIDALS